MMNVTGPTRSHCAQEPTLVARMHTFLSRSFLRYVKLLMKLTDMTVLGSCTCTSICLMLLVHARSPVGRSWSIWSSAAFTESPFIRSLIMSAFFILARSRRCRRCACAASQTWRSVLHVRLGDHFNLAYTCVYTIVFRLLLSE